MLYLLAHGIDCLQINTFCTFFVRNDTTIAYICFDNRQWTGPHAPRIYAILEQYGNRAIIIEPDGCREA